jgi:hypothetical protein
MPRSSTTYTRAISAYTNGQVLTAVALNAEADDIATALTDSFTRGETTAYGRSLVSTADAAAARGVLGITPALDSGAAAAAIFGAL